MLDHLAKENGGLILSFFFDFNDIAKQKFQGLLRSLAFQLYHDGANSADHLDACFQAHRSGRAQPETKVLRDVVFKILAAQMKVRRRMFRRLNDTRRPLNKQHKFD
jgi:hypothetical protein